MRKKTPEDHAAEAETNIIWRKKTRLGKVEAPGSEQGVGLRRKHDLNATKRKKGGERVHPAASAQDPSPKGKFNLIPTKEIPVRQKDSGKGEKKLRNGTIEKAVYPWQGKGPFNGGARGTNQKEGCASIPLFFYNYLSRNQRNNRRGCWRLNTNSTG